MNRTIVTFVILLGICIVPAHAASTPTINTTTIAASSVMSPGRYTASVAPNINAEMSARIEKAVGKVPGVESAAARAEDSTIHFTVKKGASVRVSDIEKAVISAHTGAVMSTPILEGSLKSSTGI